MIFFVFVLWFLLAEALLVLARFLLRKVRIPLWVNILLIFVELLVATALAYATIATPIGYWAISPFLMTLYIVLFADAIARAIFLIVNAIVKSKRRFTLLTTISCICAVAFLTYGMINMQVVSPKYITYSSSKLTTEHKVAFVSDVHVGSSQTMDTTLGTIAKIKAENPDFTIIGGDLVDEYTTKDEMVETVAAFKDFPGKVYFVYGNHDVCSNFTSADLEAEMTKNGVEIVVDRFVTLAPDLTLLGREDLSIKERKDIGSLVNPNPSSFLLVADHQPFNFEDNCKIGLDLQLSGHTHAGQLFPLNWIYNIAVHSYGEYHYENATLNVSSGAAGWQTPLRTEIGCQYEIITLKPAA